MAIPKHILKQHLGYWFNRLRQCVHLAFETRLAQYDITVAAWCVLISVYDGSAKSINKLSRYIEVDKASISRVVEKLVVRGLLTHEIGTYRRTGTISLTPEGLELMPHLIGAVKANEKHFFSALTDDDLAALQGIFQKVLSHSTSIKVEGWLTQKLP